ncbi:prepilin-type N-terminal cleavage/methylation domain-containing protein [Sulfurovum sp. bin170]|uniref:prepilin-type N-terminal cleavage/methylation domain-containing protein n=1 Tax=Sulfurovum sp. bin170 TaxID=2695268 RepID=UPI0013DE8C04|nr:prepilin-type N-terminal cleavage/methylation domain-containing protein [Sulfurovum sp. bin170]NEW61431.1 prepilin-type N-terminal cleavage/methylation domain-containing protein [Sulfurovum sp. bin170]
MNRTKKAFTMIEIIFVIVIVGILSLIALPKLAVTRADAKIAKLTKAIQTTQSEIILSIISQNRIPQNQQELESVSSTITELSPDYTIKVVNNKSIQFIDTDSGGEVCKVLTINDSDISRVTLEYSNGLGGGVICKGVRELIPNISSDFVIAGNAVVY